MDTVLTGVLRGGEKVEDHQIFGWLDRLDIKKWINEIVNRNGNSEDILFRIINGSTT